MSEEREALTDLVAEAHAVLKDLRAAIRDAQQADQHLRLTMRDQIDQDFAAIYQAVSEENMKVYHEGIEAAIVESKQMVHERFEHLTNLVLGTTKSAVRKGESVEQSIEAVRQIIQERGY